mmetsp:Transcript_103244/g.274559  ORF Transcript_103244/g.274559 Transcript_103244/m.274559 type:complete len:149 (-) Transcript_103244:204-650(-)
MMRQRRLHQRCAAAAFIAAVLAALRAPAPVFSGAQLTPRLTRRAAALLPLMAPPVLAPLGAEARPPRPRSITSNGKAPTELQSEEDDEKWEAIDVGESSILNKDDPKLKELGLLREIEKQKRRNEEFDAQTPEEKQEKMCELLGRGCS